MAEAANRDRARDLWTATARHADIVLPATTSLERNDVGGSSRDPFILAMHRAIDPVADAKNDFDILRALAQRLGYERAFTEGRDEMGWCQWVYDRVRASAAKGVALPGFQQFWAEGFVELPPPERDYVLFEDFRRDPERHPLKTPSGRIEIVSETDVNSVDQIQTTVPVLFLDMRYCGNQIADFAVTFVVEHLQTNETTTRRHSTKI